MHRLNTLLLCFLVLMGVSRCDTSFDPFEASDLHYSVFGYLDASAETQFIRVSPLRDSIALANEPIDAEVLLENLATGQTIVMRDSILLFNEGRVAINYWTTELLDFEATYTLTVTRSDGAQSRTTVTLPGDFPMPTLTVPLPAPGVDPLSLLQGIRADSVERLADMKVLYRIALPGAESEPFLHTESYLATVSPTADGGFLAGFNAYDDLIERFDNCPIVLESTAFVALAGPDWPDVAEVDIETLARPDVINNIENGVGYVGTITSKTIPWPELTGFLGARQALCLRG